jgi:hypothetical protein
MYADSRDGVGRYGAVIVQHDGAALVAVTSPRAQQCGCFPMMIAELRVWANHSCKRCRLAAQLVMLLAVFPKQADALAGPLDQAFARRRCASTLQIRRDDHQRKGSVKKGSTLSHQ